MSDQRDELYALSQASAREAGVPSANDFSLGVGAIVNVPEAGEWAILEREEDRFLLVPADAGGLIGSGDLEAEGGSGGPWILRCRFERWIGRRRLESFAITGRLIPEEIEQAMERRSLDYPAGMLERETDDDPEYREWIEDVVEPAAEALTRVIDSSRLEEAPRMVDDVTRLRTVLTRWRLVAALFGVAFGVTLSVSMLENRTGDPIIISNLASATVSTDSREEVHRISVKPGFENVILSLLLEPGSTRAAFRLSMFDVSGRLVFRDEPLLPDRGMIRLVLSLAGFEDGRYDIHLESVDSANEAGKKMEYAILLARERK